MKSYQTPFWVATHLVVDMWVATLNRLNRLTWFSASAPETEIATNFMAPDKSHYRLKKISFKYNPKNNASIITENALSNIFRYPYSYFA